MDTAMTLGKTRSTGRKSTGANPAAKTGSATRRPTLGEQAPPSLKIEKILSDRRFRGNPADARKALRLSSPGGIAQDCGA